VLFVVGPGITEAYALEDRLRVVKPVFAYQHLVADCLAHRSPRFGSESMAVAFLMTTSLARGWGVSGPEEWLIPKWKNASRD